MAKQPPLGSGERFAALQTALSHRGVRDPGALAYTIGKKKYGKAKMTAMAAAGRKRADNERAGQ